MRNLIKKVLSGNLHTFCKIKMHQNSLRQPTVNRNLSSTKADSDHQIDWANEMKQLQALDDKSVLEPPVTKDSYISYKPLQPTFNLAAYVNNSTTLQELVKLGVDLSKIERRKGLAQFLLKLDFEKDMKNHLMFLREVCELPADIFGTFITKNPLIFKENIDDLNTRVNYLKSKCFDSPSITRIVECNPFWLMFQTQRIDRRLGYFQKKFQLTGFEVRHLATKQPRVITYQLEAVERNTFSIREEFGFKLDEAKALILQTPNILMMNQDNLMDRLDYIHNTMKIPHNQIIRFSVILQYRKHKIKQRHEFLELLGKAQYDPSKDLYVSLKSLVVGTDMEFAESVAKTSLEKFERFLRQC